HACCRVPDVLETVHHIARDEDNGAGSGRRGLIADGQLISTLHDEEHFFLAEMNVVGRTFTRFVAPHDDREGAAGGFGGEEYLHVEAEWLDRERLFGLDDGGLSRRAFWVRILSSHSLLPPSFCGICSSSAGGGEPSEPAR